MRRLIGLAALAGCLAFAAPAAAQTPPVPTPSPTPTPTATPAPPPAKGTLTLHPLGTSRDGAVRAVVAGRSWKVRGVLRPYVAGQRFRVQIYRAGHRIADRHIGIKRSADGRSGSFEVTIGGGPAGGYAVTASHARTPELQRLRAKGVHVTAVDGAISPGERGVAVDLLQRGLARLHYAVSRSGVYDAASERAVLAWRKVTHRPRTFTASRDVLLGVLAGAGAWHVRHPDDGHHVEADISLQVLALVNGSHVERIYHMSSGKPSTPTVMGRFRVYRKEPGTNAHGMVDSSYFIGGYAIHGYSSVPTYNASHGCLRVPIPNALAIYDWVRMGDVVWVEP